MRESGPRPARPGSIDRRLYRILNRSRGPAADAAFKTITELGSLWAAVGAAAVLVRRGHRRQGVDALGAAVATWALGQGLKRLTGRPRPYDSMDGVRLLIDRPAGTSWPSSHPAVLLAFVTVATRDLGAPRPVRGGATALAGAVGLSRVCLGVHYPSDVVAGLALGRGVAALWSAVASPLVLDLRPVAGSPVQ